MRSLRLLAVLGLAVITACQNPAAVSSEPSKAAATPGSPQRWAVLYGRDAGSTYKLALISATGEVVARVTASQQLVAKGRLVEGQKVPAALLPYSASGDRLYYIDGSRLRFVTPQGAAGLVRTLDGGQRQYAFAVTADDRRFAFAEFDYTTSKPAFQMWLEDAGGGNRTDVNLGGIAYAWPFGWYRGRLIVVETDPYQGVSSEGTALMPAEGKAHLIDPATGTESLSLCAMPIGAHALCSDANNELYIESWDGSRVPEPQVGPGYCSPYGVLSPDGVTIASRDFGPSPDGNQCMASASMVLTDSSGRRTPVGTALRFPEAFLDASHLIYLTPTGDFATYQVSIVDLVTQRTHDIDVGRNIGEGITPGQFSAYCCAVFGVLPPFQS